MRPSADSLKRKLAKETDPRKRVYLLIMLADNEARSDVRQSTKRCLEAIKESRRARDKELEAVSTARAGRYFRELGQNAPSLSYCQKSVDLFKEIGDSCGEYEATVELIATVGNMGNSTKALLLAHQVLLALADQPSEAPSTEDRLLKRKPTAAQSRRNYLIRLSSVYSELGIGYYRIGNYDKALEYMQHELALSQQHHHQLASSLGNVAGVYYVRSEYGLAKKYTKQAIALHNKTNDQPSLALCYGNLAAITYEEKKLKEARALSEKSTVIYLQVNTPLLAARVLKAGAHFERQTGSLPMANRLIERALELQPTRGSVLFFQIALERVLIDHAFGQKTGIYTQLEQLYNEAAEKQLEVQQEIAVEIVRVTEADNMYREHSYWLKKVHEYALHGKDASQKAEISRLEVAYQLKELEQERALQQVKQEQLQQALQSKETEAGLLVQQLAKKGAFLASLTKQLAEMKSNKKLSAETIDAVIEHIESVRHRDSAFEQLEKNAALLDKDFLPAFTKRYPTLTQTEQRICILLRLGLSIPDSANVLFSSTRTVETHCLSIRKKLGVPKNVRLPAYFRSLS